MTAAAAMVLYSLVVLAFGPPLLNRLTRAGHNPRLGMIAWLTAIGGVLVSWIAALGFAVADLVHHWGHADAVLALCVATLRGFAYGNAGAAIQIALWTVAGLGAVWMGTNLARLVRSLCRMRRRTHGHARAVHLVGRRITGLDAVVLDADEPAAYCVAGRPHAVVITTAALGTLTEAELAAILAHERAHLDGLHPQLVAVTRAMAVSFPNLRLITDGARHLAALLEMCADDRAAAQHGRAPVLAGLLALTGSAPARIGALGATAVALSARVERLASARRAGFARTALLTAALLMTSGGPLATALLTASAMCG